MRVHRLIASLLLFPFGLAQVLAQHPKVPTTPEDLITRNLGPRDQINTPFPPHKIIGNLYFVGTQALGSFLITTPAGHILINSDFETTVPVIRGSVEKLGFRFTDIKIVLGSHAHADHMEGDALVKELTGAQVMAMAEDVPALENMVPGNKPHPIDRTLHDGEQVTLGGTTLVAHLTPGHTKGCTTWTMSLTDGARSYDVVIIGSVGVNPGVKLVNNTDYPGIADGYAQSLKTLRALHCDVPLGSHPGMYNLVEKYARLGKGSNPFIDPEGYRTEVDINERVFQRTLDEQRKLAGTAGLSPSDKKGVDDLFVEYVQAFAAKDYTKLRDCVQAPFVRVTGGEPIVVPTLDGVIALYHTLRDPLDQRGYASSELKGEAQISMLARDLILVNRAYARKKADGTLLEDVAAFYLVSHSSGKWKITGLIPQNALFAGKSY